MINLRCLYETPHNILSMILPPSEGSIGIQLMMPRNKEISPPKRNISLIEVLSLDKLITELEELTTFAVLDIKLLKMETNRYKPKMGYNLKVYLGKMPKAKRPAIIHVIPGSKRPSIIECVSNKKAPNKKFMAIPPP